MRFYKFIFLLLLAALPLAAQTNTVTLPANTPLYKSPDPKTSPIIILFEKKRIAIRRGKNNPLHFRRIIAAVEISSSRPPRSRNLLGCSRTGIQQRITRGYADITPAEKSAVKKPGYRFTGSGDPLYNNLLYRKMAENPLSPALCRNLSLLCGNLFLCIGTKR